MTFTLHFRLFVYLVLGFIAATVVGTLTHELGHIAVAKMLGYKTELHYAYMVHYDSPHELEFYDFYDQNSKVITGNKDPEIIKKFKELRERDKKENLLVVLGGPLQTMLTGTIGFLLLWFNRKKIGNKLTLVQWVLVFLTFFLSRQVYNFLSGILFLIIKGKWGHGDDETRISQLFDLPVWFVGLATALIAAVFLAITVFKLIPKQQRLTFITAGIIGSGFGVLIWLKYFGPVILP
ncbi:hypothetical protein FUA48_17250 [Flavobacterium alkalisoli]|uniref:Site-2 protease family protein n=1 Tax=Flavobacterium alkalisoli TaxID=2602769 RepID=A0A5B9FWD0_9FLAO|nr:hypothetical protein [Flavobacterium alkalisoli]QEE51245.1 hypothetical protein FUA48_17250 [Flavobacterium alkalisoli]